MSEKPLHVKVAEALGWTRSHYPGDHGFGIPGHPCGDIMLADPERLRWKGRAPDEILIGADCALIPRYDTDWSATGPLIEKYGIKIERRCEYGILWDAWVNETAHGGDRGEGHTPLIAVCSLILALHAAGKV